MFRKKNQGILLGIGEVDDLFEGIERGIDTFDCVIPTRIGRTGFFFISPPLGTIQNRFRTDIDKPNLPKIKNHWTQTAIVTLARILPEVTFIIYSEARELLSYNF